MKAGAGQHAFAIGAVIASAAALADPGGGAPEAALAPERLAAGRANYVELCGGCHGMAGTSAPARVPELKARVGYFMCTPESRDYLIRLPNVSHAALPDPADLATLMNYVVFVLGDGSAPAGAVPFRGPEVDALRRRPLDRASLKQERARLVTQMQRQCRNVPFSLRDFYAPARPAHILPAS